MYDKKVHCWRDLFLVDKLYENYGTVYDILEHFRENDFFCINDSITRITTFFFLSSVDLAKYFALSSDVLIFLSQSVSNLQECWATRGEARGALETLRRPQYADSG